MTPIPGPASPASDAAIIPHQLRHMADELAETRRRLTTAETTIATLRAVGTVPAQLCPLPAIYRRLQDGQLVAGQLLRALSVMEVAARGDGQLLLGASQAAELLVTVDRAVMGLEGPGRHAGQGVMETRIPGYPFRCSWRCNRLSGQGVMETTLPGPKKTR